MHIRQCSKERSELWCMFHIRPIQCFSHGHRHDSCMVRYQSDLSLRDLQLHLIAAWVKESTSASIGLSTWTKLVCTLLRPKSLAESNRGAVNVKSERVKEQTMKYKQCIVRCFTRVAKACTLHQFQGHRLMLN